MNCKNCDKEISDDSKFCVHCGEKILESGIKIKKSENDGNKRSFFTQLVYVVVFILAMGVARYVVQEVFSSSTSETKKENNLTLNNNPINQVGNTSDGSFNWDTDTVSLKEDLVNNSISAGESAPDQEYIDEVVVEIKKELTIPSKLDEVTELANITSEPGAIRYHYILSGVDSSQFSDESLKKYLVSSICKNTDTMNVINQNIKMEYSYILDGMPKYFVSIGKNDCLN